MFYPPPSLDLLREMQEKNRSMTVEDLAHVVHECALNRSATSEQVAKAICAKVNLPLEKLSQQNITDAIRRYRHTWRGLEELTRQIHEVLYW